MKQLRLLFIVLPLTMTAVHADVVLTLDPVTITGTPGQTVGWGFRLQADPTYYVSVSSVSIDTESNPGLGFFTDLASLAGGPSAGVLAPASPTDWVVSYDGASLAGFGEYSINPAALPGDANSGTLLMIYLRYSGDPNTCGGCFVDSKLLTTAFGVNVTAAPPPSSVPEPSSAALFGLAGSALAVAAVFRARRGGCSRL